MYQSYFGLDRMPFETVPDPSFLFESPAHQEALAALEYGIEAGAGFMLLTGGVGLGKTTIIRALLGRLAETNVTPVYVFHPQVTFAELLVLLCGALDIEAGGASTFDDLNRVQLELIRRYSNGQRVVLIIDEAQKLPVETLESVRLLSNLEQPDSKLIQIILAGQPELETLLAREELRAFAQRIEVKARLEPLTPAQGLQYLEYRLRAAGAPDPNRVMTPAARWRVVRFGRGVPRRLNIVANLTLLDSFGAGRVPAGFGSVRAAWRVYRSRHRANWRRFQVPLIAGLSVVLFLLCLLLIVWISAGDLSFHFGRKIAVAPAPAREIAAPLATTATTAPAPTETAPTAATPLPAPPETRPAVTPDAASAPPVPATASAPTNTASDAPSPEHDVTVHVGDTLLKLSHQAYGADGDAMVPELLSVNHLTDPNIIIIGQKLHFPPAHAGPHP